MKVGERASESCDGLFVCLLCFLHIKSFRVNGTFSGEIAKKKKKKNPNEVRIKNNGTKNMWKTEKKSLNS